MTVTFTPQDLAEPLHRVTTGTAWPAKTRDIAPNLPKGTCHDHHRHHPATHPTTAQTALIGAGTGLVAAALRPSSPTTGPRSSSRCR